MTQSEYEGPILEGKRRRHEPITLTHWLELNFGKVPNPIDAEMAEMVPEIFDKELEALMTTQHDLISRQKKDSASRSTSDLQNLPFDPAVGAQDEE